MVDLVPVKNYMGADVVMPLHLDEGFKVWGEENRFSEAERHAWNSNTFFPSLTCTCTCSAHDKRKA